MQAPTPEAGITSKLTTSRAATKLRKRVNVVTVMFVILSLLSPIAVRLVKRVCNYDHNHARQSLRDRSCYRYTLLVATVRHISWPFIRSQHSLLSFPFHDGNQRIQIEQYSDREENAAKNHKGYKSDGARPHHTDRFNEKSQEKETSRELQPALN